MPNYEKVQWQDRVKDQNGNVIQEGTPLSAKNMNRLEEGIDLSVNVEGAMIAELLHQVNALKKEEDKLLKQKLQQGTIYLYNKYVKSGCKINKMANSRYVEVCRTGTFINGDVSIIYTDGKEVPIPDEQAIVMIPQNNTASSKVFFIYIDYLDNRYKVTISENEPKDKLIIYKATVPANDLRPDLNSVTLTDVRKIINNNYIRSSEPFCTVSLPGYSVLDSDYGVYVTIDEATDIQRIGDIVIYDKQPNGFKIKITGDADNVKLRWSLINPNLK